MTRFQESDEDVRVAIEKVREALVVIEICMAHGTFMEVDAPVRCAVGKDEPYNDGTSFMVAAVAPTLHSGNLLVHQVIGNDIGEMLKHMAELLRFGGVSSTTGEQSFVLTLDSKMWTHYVQGGLFHEA